VSHIDKYDERWEKVNVLSEIQSLIENLDLLKNASKPNKSEMLSR
jgi:hypothetical protein